MQLTLRHFSLNKYINNPVWMPGSQSSSCFCWMTKMCLFTACLALDFFSLRQLIRITEQRGKKKRKDRFSPIGKRSGISLNSTWWVQKGRTDGPVQRLDVTFVPKMAPGILINQGDCFGRYKTSHKNGNTWYLSDFKIFPFPPYIYTSKWADWGAL